MLKYESDWQIGFVICMASLVKRLIAPARSGGAEIVGKLAAGGVVLVLEAPTCEAVEYKMVQIPPTSIFGRFSF